jgi:PST family polysaccharide transporter
MYLMVVTSSLGVYYLPRLSEIKDNIELKKEILNGYKIIIPIVVIMSLTIFILRELAIKIAFNESFMPMKELFKWQLIGDVIKITSWLLSYLMLAKAMTKIFIYTEVLFNFSFVALAVIFINNYGVIGVTYAFALNYFFYLIIMIFMFRSKF